MDGGGKKMKLQLEVMVNVYFLLAELYSSSGELQNDHCGECSTRKQICYISVARIVCMSRIC